MAEKRNKNLIRNFVEITTQIISLKSLKVALNHSNANETVLRYVNIFYAREVTSKRGEIGTGRTYN